MDLDFKGHSKRTIKYSYCTCYVINKHKYIMYFNFLNMFISYTENIIFYYMYFRILSVFLVCLRITLSWKYVEAIYFCGGMIWKSVINKTVMFILNKYKVLWFVAYIQRLRIQDI